MFKELFWRNSLFWIMSFTVTCSLDGFRLIFLIIFCLSWNTAWCNLHTLRWSSQQGHCKIISMGHFKYILFLSSLISASIWADVIKIRWFLSSEMLKTRQLMASPPGPHRGPQRPPDPGFRTGNFQAGLVTFQTYQPCCLLVSRHYLIHCYKTVNCDINDIHTDIM